MKMRLLNRVKVLVMAAVFVATALGPQAGSAMVAQAPETALLASATQPGAMDASALHAETGDVICTAPPRDLDSLSDLVAPVSDEVATAAPSGGIAPDEATLTAIRDIAEQYVACINSGDFLRLFGLYTDQAIAREFGPLLQDASFMAFLAAPPSPRAADEQMALRAVRDAAMRNTDRVGAVVMVDDPLTPEMSATYHCEFTRLGGRWFIDRAERITDVAPAPLGGSQTPPAQVIVDSDTFTPTPVSRGRLLVRAYNCPGDTAAISNWSADCIEPASGVKVSLSRSGGEAVSVTTSDDLGVATFEGLAAGSYALELVEAYWCFASSDSIDGGGNLVVGPGAEIEVSIYFCDR